MGEPDPLVVQLDHRGCQRALESGVAALSDGRLDELDGRIGEGRDHLHHLQRRRLESGEPGGEEIIEPR